MMEQQIIVIQTEQLKAIIDETVNNVLTRTGVIKKETPKYYTREELTKKWHISRTTLWKYQKLGIVKPLHIGNKVVFEREDIDKIDLTKVNFKKSA